LMFGDKESKDILIFKCMRMRYVEELSSCLVGIYDSVFFK